MTTNVVWVKRADGSFSECHGVCSEPHTHFRFVDGQPRVVESVPEVPAADEMADADVAEVDRRFAELVASGRLSEEKLRATFDKRFPQTSSATKWQARVPADELTGWLAQALKERDEARAHVASIRRTDSEEARAFWASVDRTVEEVAKWPEWMKRATISETGNRSAPTAPAAAGGDVRWDALAEFADMKRERDEAVAFEASVREAVGVNFRPGDREALLTYVQHMAKDYAEVANKTRSLQWQEERLTKWEAAVKAQADEANAKLRAELAAIEAVLDEADIGPYADWRGDDVVSLKEAVRELATTYRWPGRRAIQTTPERARAVPKLDEVARKTIDPSAIARMVPARRVRLVRLGTVQSASTFAWGRTIIRFAAHQDAGRRLVLGTLGAHGAWVRASETDDQALNGQDRGRWRVLQQGSVETAVVPSAQREVVVDGLAAAGVLVVGDTLWLEVEDAGQ